MRLAQSYQLLTRDVTRYMVFYDVRPISLQLLESMRVLVRGTNGILQIRLDDVVVEEGEAEPFPER